MVGGEGDQGNGRGICQTSRVERNILLMSEYSAQNDAEPRPQSWPESRSRRPTPAKRDRPPPPAATRAMRFELQADSTVEQALGRTLRYCLTHLGANQVCVLESDDPGGIHQMRVALRRLRSAFRLFRSVLPGATYRAQTDEMKWLTGRLEAARDWDVFAGEIVAPVVARTPGEDYGALLARLGVARRESRHAAREAVRSPRYQRFVADLGAGLARRAWRVEMADGLLAAPMSGLAASLLAGCRGKVVVRGEQFAALSPAERHRLRIAVKRLRYATDFFGSLYDPALVGPYSERLAAIQDALGCRNDVVVARRLMGQLSDGGACDEAEACRRAGALVIDWHERTQARSEAALVRAITGFFAEPPYWPRVG